MLKFIQAESTEEIKQARTLFEEYASWLQISLCFQGFEQEVVGLPGSYAPDSGRLLLAVLDEQIAGCVALRQLDIDCCEMKRLFVRPEFQGAGLGRALTERIIEEARAIGYKRMRLDTLPGKMDRAIALYRSLSFQEIPPYYKNPVPGAKFMELSLR